MSTVSFSNDRVNTSALQDDSFSNAPSHLVEKDKKVHSNNHHSEMINPLLNLALTVLHVGLGILASNPVLVGISVINGLFNGGLLAHTWTYHAEHINTVAMNGMLATAMLSLIAAPFYPQPVTMGVWILAGAATLFNLSFNLNSCMIAQFPDANVDNK